VECNILRQLDMLCVGRHEAQQVFIMHTTANRVACLRSAKAINSAKYNEYLLYGETLGRKDTFRYRGAFSAAYSQETLNIYIFSNITTALTTDKKTTHYNLQYTRIL
jgi:hypothetical protein